MPIFFIVGEPKSGTTALDNHLMQNPNFPMATKKESHYFADDFHSPHYTSQLDRYLKLSSTNNDSICIGESSVHYLSSKRAASRI